MENRLKARRCQRRETQPQDEKEREGKLDRVGTADYRMAQCREGAGAVRMRLLAIVAMAGLRNGNLPGDDMAERVGADVDGQHFRPAIDHEACGDQRFHAQRCRDDNRGKGAVARKESAKDVHGC